MRKAKICIALICLSFLFVAVGDATLADTPVASVDGTIYTTLQEAADAAARSGTEAARVITLLADIDLGGEPVALRACNITLNLNGHTIAGAAETLIALRGGARLVVTDIESGGGVIYSAFPGAGCAVLLEDAQSSLVISAGAIETASGGAAVRCSAGAAVVVNGGSVGGIAGADGAAPARNDGGEALLQYDLTVGKPPLAGAVAFGLATRPGLSYSYGPAVASADGVIHVWLPAGQTEAAVQVGCVVYSGKIEGEQPYAGVLTKTGDRHDFTGGWRTSAAEHWKVCQNDGCLHEANRGAHAGGKDTCTGPAACSVCGAPYGTALGHAYAADFTVDAEPACTAAGSKSRHCTRCDARTDITSIPALGHDFDDEFTVDIKESCSSEGVESRHCKRASCTATIGARPIPAPPHPFSAEWSSDGDGHWHDSTCDCGETDGYWAHEPETDDHDCTTPLCCSVCGYELVPAESGHSWDDTMTSATEHWDVCGNDGCAQTTEHEAHYGGEATCYDRAVCVLCAAEYGPLAPHTPEAEYEVITAATCETEGLEKLYCAECYAILDSRPILAKGHNWGTWWTDAVATCSAAGSQHRFCLRNTSHTETRTVPIDPDAHFWGAGVTTTPHTCTTEGVRTYTCTRNAAHTRTESIPIPAHHHTVRFSQPADGSLTVADGSGPIGSVTSVPCKTDLVITAAPNEGYHVDSLTVNGAAFTNGGTYRVMNGDAAIAAAMAINTYTITAAAGANGSITNSGTITVNHGANQTYYVTPDAGYATKRVVVDGEDRGAIVGFTFRDVQDNHTISAEFVRVHEIAANAGTGGTISPPGTTQAEQGSDQSYTITPDGGYKVLDVLVDGVSVGAATSYTFTNVTAAHAISATFVRAYTITLNVYMTGSYGTVSPGTSVVTEGDSITFTVTPNPGYRAKIQVDGVNVSETASYTFTNVTAAHTINVSFVDDTYSITASAGDNGTISPSGSISVAGGADQTFTFTANAGYRVRALMIDSTIILYTDSTYTFTNVRANSSIHVSFEEIPAPLMAGAGARGSLMSPDAAYTILAGPMSNGSVSASASAARPGETVFLEIKPDADYRLKAGSLQVNGVAIAGTAFTMPAQDVTVTGEFEKYINKIDIAGTDHGSVTASLPCGGAEAGALVTLTVTPDAGCGLVAGSLKVNGTAIAGTTFTMPMQDVRITAAFERLPEPAGAEGSGDRTAGAPEETASPDGTPEETAAPGGAD